MQKLAKYRPFSENLEGQFSSGNGEARMVANGVRSACLDL